MVTKLYYPTSCSLEFMREGTRKVAPPLLAYLCCYIIRKVMMVSLVVVCFPRPYMVPHMDAP